jgi:hypothetical protein
VRKLAHVGIELATLSFPFLFHSTWPIVFLSGLSIAAMIAPPLVAPLKQGFGSVLHGVAPSSDGEIYFPLSVAILFVLAKGNFRAVHYSDSDPDLRRHRGGADRRLRQATIVLLCSALTLLVNFAS